MIDLEDRLSALVETAPAAPPIAEVTHRARQRRRRRRGAELATVVVAVAVAISGVAAAHARESGSHLRITGPISTPADKTLRVTLLDGSQLEISGPAGLGLTHLPIAFSATLDTPDPPLYGYGHTLSVERAAPSDLGPEVARYPTHDGHELVVSSTSSGVDAVVQYDEWVLVVTWNHDPTNWPVFASELNAKETADGYLVLEPVDSGWQVSHGDGPDVQLGGTGYGGGATYSFFGPRFYPAECPTDSQTVARTPQGWPVRTDDMGAEWCDATAHVRITASDPSTADAAVQGLRVAYTDAAHEVDDVTALDGQSVEITAPSSVLDQLGLQGSVFVDGLDTPNLLNTTPNLLPVSATRESLPSTATAPSYPTADGHALFSYTPPTACGCEMLAGSYGPWLVQIEVTGMSDAQRTQIASLFRASATAGGFLTLDPAPGMHVGPGGPAIVLDEVDVSPYRSGKCTTDSVEARTPEGFGVHVVGNNASWCDTVARVSIDVRDDPTHALINQIRVRRLAG